MSSKTSSVYNYIKDVWDETFPNEDNKVRQKIQKRKELARIQKEMEENEEYIMQMQEQIPEWKRGAITVTDS